MGPRRVEEFPGSDGVYLSWTLYCADKIPAPDSIFRNNRPWLGSALIPMKDTKPGALDEHKISILHP